MKKVLAMLLAGAMVLSLAACGGGNNGGGGGGNAGGGDDKPVTLIGGDTASRGAAGQLFGEAVAANLEKAGSTVTLDYHPNGDLGDDSTLLRQVQGNDLQIVVCQTAPVVNLVPEMAVFDLPMVFAPYTGDQIEAVLNGDSEFHKQLQSAYEANGFHLLGFLQNATYRLTTSKKPLNTLADFQGLVIRTMENENHVAFWTAIGASPSPLTWSETYFALQTGSRDAQENAADTIVGNNLQEVQQYLDCTNHILYANQMAISLEAWNSLSDTQKADLEKAVADALAELRPQLAQIDQDNKDLLEKDEKNPMTIVTYENSFFEEVMAVQGVKDLYAKIDGDTNGLATTLQDSLAG